MLQLWHVNPPLVGCHGVLDALMLSFCVVAVAARNSPCSCHGGLSLLVIILVCPLCWLLLLSLIVTSAVIVAVH